MKTADVNVQIIRDLAEIADDEALMKRLAKYLKKLVAKKNDPTLMTKEEFFRRIDEAKEGTSMSFESVAELDQYIRNYGHV